MIDDNHDRLRYRSPGLILALLGMIYDEPNPIRWPDLVAEFATTTTPTKTIENTLHDLAKYGAIHKSGRYTARNDTRTVTGTTLGQAWLNQQLVPHPNERTTA